MGVFSRSRSRLLFVACLVVAGYFVFIALTGVIQNHRLADQRKEEAALTAELAGEKAYLEAVRNYVASDAYVEQEARRQLGYTRYGEVPFVVTSPAPKDDGPPTGKWWQRLFPR